MSGMIIPGTSIAVDYWRVKSCLEARVFFLTHMHADHVQGLKPSWCRPIYCSPLTKKLLIHNYQFSEDIIRELEVDQSHIIELRHNNTMTVTVMDANHCPGAVMFLFEGRFGRILYTGDFRFSGPMLNDMTFLTNCTSNIDVLYIDNTYLDPKCCFPSQEESLVQILEIIRANEGARVMIGLRNLGKEKLLVGLAGHLNEVIGVDEARYELLKIINAPDVFGVSPSSRLQVVSLSEIKMKNMETWNRECLTIAIIPSALGVAVGQQMFCQRSDVYVVPYSDHSCYQELIEFVQMVEPAKVMPILRHCLKDRLSVALQGRSDMSCFDIYINPRQPAGGCSATPDDGGEVSADPVVLGRITIRSVPSSKQICYTSSSNSRLTPSTSKKRAAGMVRSSGKRATEKGVVYDSSQSPMKVASTEEREDESTVNIPTCADVRHPSQPFSNSNTLKYSNKGEMTVHGSNSCWSPFRIGNRQCAVNVSPSQIMKNLEPLLRQEACRLLSLENSLRVSGSSRVEK